MKKIIAKIMMLACIMLIGGCDSSTTTEPEATSQQEQEIVTISGTDLACIPDCEYLVYSVNTKTVYYLFEIGFSKSARGYMANFISNEHYCEYRDGQVVEVKDGNVVAVVDLSAVVK